MGRGLDASLPRTPPTPALAPPPYRPMPPGLETPCNLRTGREWAPKLGAGRQICRETSHRIVTMIGVPSDTQTSRHHPSSSKWRPGRSIVSNQSRKVDGRKQRRPATLSSIRGIKNSMQGGEPRSSSHSEGGNHHRIPERCYMLFRCIQVRKVVARVLFTTQTVQTSTGSWVS